MSFGDKNVPVIVLEFADNIVDDQYWVDLHDSDLTRTRSGMMMILV